jgi:hypothetical protein
MRCFTPSTTDFAGSGCAGSAIFVAGLTCPQIKRSANRAAPPLLRALKRHGWMPHARHESLGCLCKGYVMEINECKQRPVHRI